MIYSKAKIPQTELRLPLKFNDKLWGLKQTQYHIDLNHAGITIPENLPVCSLKLYILTKQLLQHRVSSDSVVFYGKDYALLGIDFMNQWESLLIVNARKNRFSFTIRLQ